MDSEADKPEVVGEVPGEVKRTERSVNAASFLRDGTKKFEFFCVMRTSELYVNVFSLSVSG